MRHRLGPHAALAAIAAAAMTVAASADQRSVKGKVVDERGRPVAGAVVASFWHFEDGKGAPLSPAVTTPRGAFEAGAYFAPGRSASLLALDEQQQRGGLAVVADEASGDPVTITIGPLVRVGGRIACSDPAIAASWTNVYASVMPSRARVADCQSKAAEISMLLPPGEYDLWLYGTDLRDRHEKIVVDAAAAAMDLGVLTLEPTIIAQHYGKAPPPWHVTDARGVPRTVQLSDYRGKWVLLEFWGFW